MSDINSEGSYPSDGSLEDEMRDMAGYRSQEEDVLGVLNSDQIEELGTFTRTDVDQGETSRFDDMAEPEESLEQLISENLREGETDDAMESVQEGLSYVPPIDAPSLDGDYDQDSDEMLDDDQASLAQRVRAHLLRDSSTEALARQIQIRATSDGLVALHGTISDLTDEELLLGVVEQVEGVEEVESRLKVAGID